MRRISVIGASGSGKTTVARTLATKLVVPRLELDAIYHLADWQPIATEEFRFLVSRFAAGDGWVVDGNYSRVRDIVWERADTVVFLDYPRWLIMRRLVPRTLRRILTRQHLWNGNTEPLSNLYSRNPEANVILWSWQTHARVRQQFMQARSDLRWTHLTFVRLPSPTATQRFLAQH